MSKKKEIARKDHSRNVKEHDVFKSDRIELVGEANRLVGHMVTKQIIRVGVFGEPVQLEEEDQAYKSALNFLTRQFDQGYSETETAIRRVEVEQTKERETNG